MSWRELQRSKASDRRYSQQEIHPSAVQLYDNRPGITRNCGRSSNLRTQTTRSQVYNCDGSHGTTNTHGTDDQKSATTTMARNSYYVRIRHNPHQRIREYSSRRFV